MSGALPIEHAIGQGGAASTRATTDETGAAHRVLLRGVQDAVQRRVLGVGASSVTGETFLGRYRIERFAGKGAMGTVLVAEDTWLERRVALKIVNTPGPRQRRRLVREGIALAKLSHPNVVQVHDVDIGERGAVAYVAMEYVEGSTLHRWQTAEPRGVEEIVDKYLQAARGLRAAHEVGIIHRDFKPHNALVDEAGVVKVADFGLARTFERESGDGTVMAAAERAVTEPKEMGGSETAQGFTPGYGAPEQIRGLRVTEKTDQFAFCAALYEALTGELPFGASRDPDEHERQAGEGVSRRSELSGLPRRIRKVLARGLAPRPEERFADMDGLIAALERRPSRWSWLGLGAVPVAAVAAMMLSGPPEEVQVEVDPCEYPEEALPLRWEVEAGEYVEEAAERYRGQWRTAAQELCKASRRGEIDEEEHGQGMACLEEAAREHDLVASLVVAGDPRVDPLDAFEALRSPQLCVAVEGRPSFARLDPEIQEELGRVRALQLAGRNDEALALATEIHDRAIVGSDLVVLTRSSFLRGKLEMLVGDERSAAAHLEEAALYAERLSDDILALEAYSELIEVAARLKSEPSVGERWKKIAEAKLGRVGRHGDAVAGQVYSAVANLEFRYQDYDDAAEYYRAAYESSSKTDGAESIAALSARTNLALVSLELGDHDGAAVELERIIDVRRRRFGSGHSSTLGDEMRLGDVYGRVGRSREAMAAFARVEMEAGQSPSSDAPRIAAFASVRQCEQLVREEAISEAEAPCERASYKLSLLKGNDKLVLHAKARFHAAAGHLNLRKGRFQGALSHYLRERELRLSILPLHEATLAMNTNGVCAALIALSRGAECRGYLEQARQWYESSDRVDDMDRVVRLFEKYVEPWEKRE